MTLFLRTKDGKTIIDMELWTKSMPENKDHTYHEISCSIDIKNYSEKLIELHNKDCHYQFIEAIDHLSEVRRWLWEFYFMNKKNDGSDENYKKILGILRKKLDAAALNFDLVRVED